MKKKTFLYVAILVLAISLIIISLTVFGETSYIALIMIGLSVYFFIGALIKLCKMNNKLKDTVLCSLDLLFWMWFFN